MFEYNKHTSKYCSCKHCQWRQIWGTSQGLKRTFRRFEPERLSQQNPKDQCGSLMKLSTRLDHPLNATMEGTYESNGDASSLAQFQCSQVLISLKILFKRQLQLGASCHIKPKKQQCHLLTTLTPKASFLQAPRLSVSAFELQEKQAKVPIYCMMFRLQRLSKNISYSR